MEELQKSTQYDKLWKKVMSKVMYSRHDFIDLWMKSHISNLNPIRHFEHIPFEWLRWGGARIRNFLNQIVQPQLPTMDFQEFQPLRCLGYSPFLHTVR